MSPTPSLPLSGFASLAEVYHRARAKWSFDWSGHFRGLLVTKQLIAWLSDDLGNLKEIAATYWAGDEGKKISEGALRDLSSHVRLPIFRIEDLQREIPYDYEIRQEQKAKEREAKAQQRVPVPANNSPKNKGGHPLEYNWDEIWVEMCAYLDREGPPETYAALVSHIQTWLGENAPSKNSIHPKAKALIDRLKRDQGQSPAT
jgi:hypothetical protein